MARNKLKAKPEDYKSPLELPYIKKIIFSLTTVGAWPHDVLGQKLWFSDFRNSKFLFCFWFFLNSLCAKYLKKNIGVINFLDLGRTYINVLMCSCVLVCIGFYIILSIYKNYSLKYHNLYFCYHECPVFCHNAKPSFALYYLWEKSSLTKRVPLFQRICSTWTDRYKITSKNFIDKIHLFYFKDKSEYSMKVYEEVDNIASLFTRVLHIELYFGVVLYNLTPLYNSYHRGMFKDVKPANATYDQACDYDVPFNYETDFRGFLFVYIINCFVTFDVASSFIAIDLYISVIVFHLWGHLKILQHNLRHFPRPKMESVQMNSITNPPWYNEEESKQIKTMLVDSMSHYKIIKDFMDEVSMAFGLIICVYHLFHQIIGCILLLEIAQLKPEAFGTYGMLTLTAFQQLIQMSIVFELIGSQSETIKDAVYEVPWECMDTKNRKTVFIYLCNVQKPMNLKALGMLPVGVQTMASILKTSMSYFMLLRTSVDN